MLTGNWSRDMCVSLARDEQAAPPNSNVIVARTIERARVFMSAHHHWAGRRLRCLLLLHLGLLRLLCLHLLILGLALCMEGLALRRLSQRTQRPVHGLGIVEATCPFSSTVLRSTFVMGSGEL